MANLHDQKQIPTLVAVVADIGCRMAAQVQAEMGGETHGLAKRWSTCCSRKADRANPRAQRSSHLFGKGATVDIAETYEHQPLNLRRLQLKVTVQPACNILQLSQDHTHAPTPGTMVGVD